MQGGNGRLLIVYNADGGLWNAFLDTLQKIVSPSTYSCSLCAITYGLLSMHNDWRRFLDSLPLTIEYFHRDEFTEAFPGTNIAFPALLIAHGSAEPRMLIPAQELDDLADIAGLMERVEERLITEQLRTPALRIVTQGR